MQGLSNPSLVNGFVGLLTNTCQIPRPFCGTHVHVYFLCAGGVGPKVSKNKTKHSYRELNLFFTALKIFLAPPLFVGIDKVCHSYSYCKHLYLSSCSLSFSWGLIQYGTFIVTEHLYWSSSSARVYTFGFISFHSIRCIFRKGSKIIS